MLRFLAQDSHFKDHRELQAHHLYSMEENNANDPKHIPEALTLAQWLIVNDGGNA